MKRQRRRRRKNDEHKTQYVRLSLLIYNKHRVILCETDVHTHRIEYSHYDLYYTDDLRSRTGKFFHTHLSIYLEFYIYV